MTWFAQRKSIKNGTVSFNNRTGEYAEMLRQYFLYCASAATNADGNELDYVEFGTVEQGPIKHEVFNHPAEPAEVVEVEEPGEGE